MKKRIIAALTAATLLSTTLITGCGTSAPDEGTEELDIAISDYATPDDVEQTKYATEDELPEDMFYIVHTEENEDGEEVPYYYPVYAAERTYDDVISEPAGASPTRIQWVNYNVDEGYIPTFYPGDKMIYKSSTSIPTIYSLEKFYDDGYTVGVAGLQQDLSGNYKYDYENGGFTMSTSDAVGFDGLVAESIYFVKAGDMAITPQNVSSSGTVTGLELMHAYRCDIRTGTEKVDATLTANIHSFSSAENYLFGSFTFISEHIAEINLPEYVTTGYYNLNGIGMFRFLKTEESYEDLTEEDYNDIIYTYDEVYSRPQGTVNGYILDENGFLVKSDDVSDEDYDSSAYGADESTLAEMEADGVAIPDANGYTSGTFEMTSVDEGTVYASGAYYAINATDIESDAVFTARLYIENSSSIEVPEVGSRYVLTYAEATRSDYNGNEIFTINEVE